MGAAGPSDVGPCAGAARLVTGNANVSASRPAHSDRPRCTSSAIEFVIHVVLDGWQLLPGFGLGRGRIRLWRLDDGLRRGSNVAGLLGRFGIGIGFRLAAVALGLVDRGRLAGLALAV